MSSEPTFAVCIFDRVFDTEPARAVVSLEALTGALTRFELKPSVQEAIERDLARIERAWEAWRAGREISGKWWSAIAKAGAEGDAAAQTAREKLRDGVNKSAKREIRLWSPALYPPDAKRGSENVLHISCLVLDFDDGTPLDEASARFHAWFHIAHTTWSHSAEHHKFRLILPLSRPVFAKDWEKVWRWAHQRAGQAPDPSGSGPGATFALPVVPTTDWPRTAFVHAGGLLDAELEGLVEATDDPPEPPADAADGWWQRGDPEKTYLREDPAEPDAYEDDLWSDPFGLEQPAHVAEPTRSDPAPAPAPASAPSDEVLARLDRIERRLKGPLLVDALERLARLHRDGALSDAEFERGKRQVLASDEAAGE